MRVGEDVDINVDAYNGVTFRGRIDSLGPAAEDAFSLIPAQNATGNFRESHAASPGTHRCRRRSCGQTAARWYVGRNVSQGQVAC